MKEKNVPTSKKCIFQVLVHYLELLIITLWAPLNNSKQQLEKDQMAI